MPRGEQRGNRESKKPKKEKPKVIAANPPGGGYDPSKTIGAGKGGKK